MYSSPSLTPQCRHEAQPSCRSSGSRRATTVPAVTCVPLGSWSITGSKLVRSPSSVVMVMTPRSTTQPEWDTVPDVGARISWALAQSRSMPRCPAVHFWTGFAKGRTTGGLGERGQLHDGTRRGVADGAVQPADRTVSVVRTNARRERMTSVHRRSRFGSASCEGPARCQWKSVIDIGEYLVGGQFARAV